MMFVNPAFLWALFAVSLPIIIHLFNFRKYKKVYFTNVRFLKEIKQESKSKSRLKEILILIARCLCIASLVLAFSEPFIPGQNNAAVQSKNLVSIYIDNSFSMDNVNKQGPLLSVAKMKAIEIARAFQGSDKIQIITNDFEGKHQRFYSAEDIIPAIEEIKLSPAFKPLSRVVQRQTEFLKGESEGARKLFLITDAQKSSTDIENFPSDSSTAIHLIPLASNAINNVFIDSCWFETPLQQKGFIQKLHVVITNSGNNKINAGTAKLTINKRSVAIQSYSVEPNNRKEVLFTFELTESAFNFGSVKIEDFPITYDDELFFAFNSRINIPVCLINGKNSEDKNSFYNLLSNDSLFDLKSFKEQAVDFAAFKNASLIVLNELSQVSSGLNSELLKYVREGGNIVIVPSRQAELATYNQLLTALQLPSFINSDTATLKTADIESSNKFYSGVFEKMEERINLPQVNFHYVLTNNSKSGFENILRLQNGEILLGKIESVKGRVYLFTAPISSGSGNIGKHALFVPTVYKMAFESLDNNEVYYSLQSNSPIMLRQTEELESLPPHIISPDQKTDIIPEARKTLNGTIIFTRNQLQTAGFYKLIQDKKELLPLAFNYSRKESNLEAYSTEELTEYFNKSNKSVSILNTQEGSMTRQITEMAKGKMLWKIFIISALIFLLIEILLLRLLKH